MSHRASRLLLVALLPVTACVAPSGDESASTEDALTGDDLVTVAAASSVAGDIPGIKFVGAATTARELGRPGEIDYVIIHDIEGSGRAGVNTFQERNAVTSAHYVVDKKGVAVQMVREEDTANHAGHNLFNGYGIGIEHAGFTAQGGYTDAEYEASARIVASVVARYHIPIDRSHIIGHYQVPRTDLVVTACGEHAKDCGGRSKHDDPGPHWDWTGYLSRVKDKARALGYAGPDPAELARRALVPVSTITTLVPSKPLFVGYWATQCDADDPSKQMTFRITNLAPATIESRYAQSRVGECGTKTNGSYPLVFRGMPTAAPPSPDLDLHDVSIDVCVDHQKHVFHYDGATVPCARAHGNGACKDPALPLVSTGGGC